MANNVFYVHIIESPSPEDLLGGRTEGNTLCSFLTLAGIPHQYNLVVDREQLNSALTTRIRDAYGQLKVKPIIHISAHGGLNGIQLTDHRNTHGLLTWPELSNYLAPINKAFEGVGVCLSSCGGTHGKRMAEVILADQVPMGWLVGTAQSLNYCDAALAFVVFYRQFQRGVPEDELIAAMRAASGIADFNLDYGHVVQKAYSAALIKSLFPSFPEWVK